MYVCVYVSVYFYTCMCANNFFLLTIPPFLLLFDNKRMSEIQLLIAIKTRVFLLGLAFENKQLK